ncbi:MAG: nuclear transport factor 2 family protein [Geminocystis sp.]|nr:nuclear transport factor 2 family protein [Geminocystis sp.]HIK36660.1 nuclear transport factor 2 family protein [Geminocystis sp. M7585_C2015_104]MCS7148463.1 nuclear transport factor 2 family protein [Geminocystis sp.]MCX8079418.1 nuclear transport factor 2 family protein [Geminocystis sp.]MDW8114963.1 nuclear transport factor 2 family protein [Geminocystis sp.]
MEMERVRRGEIKHFYLSFLVSLLLFSAAPVRAQDNTKIPPHLSKLVSLIDEAANERNIEKIKGLLSPQFAGQDGLNRDLFLQALANLWQKYPGMQYRTTIKNFTEKEGKYVVETVTNIDGKYEEEGREFKIKSEITSRQYFENGLFAKQEILKEKTEITSGNNPPQIVVRLPERVRPGQEFDFDVILQEPLAGDIVLAGVSESIVSPSLHLQPPSIELNSISSGGIFKRVNIPTPSSDHLYSAILIRDGGIRIISLRLKVQP